MKHIEINIWKACNHKCIFCMSWITRNKVLWFESFETIKNEIENIASLGYNSIWFLWWEPTIHPNFLEIVSYAKKNNFSDIEVITNWSKFWDKDFLIKTIESWITRISVSFHSIYEDEEKVLVWWIRWIVKEKLSAISNLLEIINSWLLKREISINIVISKINYKSIKKTILFLYKMWIKSFRLNFIQLEWYSTKNYEILAIKYEDFKEELFNILSLCNKYEDLRINFEAIPWCFTWLNYRDFLKYSEQEIDRKKDKVSRDDEDLVSRNILNQLKWRRDLKVYLEKCSNCFLKWECEWVWRRYLVYYKLH